MLRKKVKKNKYFIRSMKYKYQMEKTILLRYIRRYLKQYITNAKLLKYPFRLKIYRYVSQKGKKFPETTK